MGGKGKEFFFFEGKRKCFCTCILFFSSHTTKNTLLMYKTDFTFSMGPYFAKFVEESRSLNISPIPVHLNCSSGMLPA